MSEEAESFTRISVSGAPTVSESHLTRCCQTSYRRHHDKEHKQYGDEDMVLIRLKRMALNLERAMIVKQQRLHRLTKRANGSYRSSESSMTIGIPVNSRQLIQHTRTRRLRDAAPRTPKRQLSDDLSEFPQESDSTGTLQADDKWKNRCSEEQKPPPRRCKSDNVTLTELIERGMLTCCSNQEILSRDFSFHEAAPGLYYSFTFPPSVESKTHERISNDNDDGSLTNSSASSADSISASSSDSDRDIKLNADLSVRKPSYRMLQQVEEIECTFEDERNKSPLKTAASRFSSIFLNDDDACTTTSESSSSTIRASNRSPRLYHGERMHRIHCSNHL